MQYPEEVSSAVSRKLAATANAMQIIRGQLSVMYIQHAAIEAQKNMRRRKPR